MAKSADSDIYISNTTQGTLSLNCSFVDKDGRVVDLFHDIPPARQQFGVKIPRADWDRVKNTPIVMAWVDGGFLLPEKKKVTIDQETLKTSSPEPTGELAEISLTNLVKGKSAETQHGSRKSRMKLQGA